MMKISLEDAYMCFPHVYFLVSLKDATAGLIFKISTKRVFMSHIIGTYLES